MLETPEKIRELQRKLYQKAKQEKGYRFYFLLHGPELRKPQGEDDWKAVYGKTVRTV
jgi:hypothetical protein